MVTKEIVNAVIATRYENTTVGRQNVAPTPLIRDLIPSFFLGAVQRPVGFCHQTL